nr:Calcium-binding EF-hand family protein [Ipomoea batatas]
MSVEILDAATILNFVQDEKVFDEFVHERFDNLDSNHDGVLSYAELLKELRSLRVLEMHFGVDVETNPTELNRVYDSMFVQFDRDSSGEVDVKEFKEEMKNMMVAMANDIGFLPVQMLLEENSFLKKAVEKETTKIIANAA